MDLGLLILDFVEKECSLFLPICGGDCLFDAAELW
jgi:hypothetical protein